MEFYRAAASFRKPPQKAASAAARGSDTVRTGTPARESACDVDRDRHVTALCRSSAAGARAGARGERIARIKFAITQLVAISRRQSFHQVAGPAARRRGRPFNRPLYVNVRHLDGPRTGPGAGGPSRAALIRIAADRCRTNRAGPREAVESRGRIAQCLQSAPLTGEINDYRSARRLSNPLT
ncbi:hypothetical protein EVAR_46605_1 [Eumeta japonica]|uniref:Uncharacterized protein n=1 Tax=Eumeta variegata TaxID=151549 RepID=A0A4C1ZBK0_EUMVA|nr:hypothetical protein EVAR_46605_1 [Eumeta japonica]